ncbi:hypothetical protein Nmel_005192 [Mimus melanotis]
MSRKASDNVEYTLRSLSNLMGEKRRRQADGSAGSGAAAGERSLIAAESCSSLNSAASGGELERAARRQFQQDETPGFVYVVSVFSALGGFLFGYDTGVVSGALLLLKRELNLDALWQELLVSSTVGAAALSALAGGVLNGLCGRRPCILLASGLFTVGSGVLAAARDKETLLAGRVVVGLGIGFFRVALCKLPIKRSTPDTCLRQLLQASVLELSGLFSTWCIWERLSSTHLISSGGFEELSKSNGQPAKDIQVLDYWTVEVSSSYISTGMGNLPEGKRSLLCPSLVCVWPVDSTVGGASERSLDSQTFSLTEMQVILLNWKCKLYIHRYIYTNWHILVIEKKKIAKNQATSKKHSKMYLSEERSSRVIKVLYHLMRFTKNNGVFAQLSLWADLELCLNPPLLMCLENEIGQERAALQGDLRSCAQC